MAFYVAIKEIAVLNRQRKNMKDVDSLAAEIRSVAKQRGSEDGLINAITLRKPDPGETDLPWVLVAGGRRLAAHILLGREQIRAEDFADLDPITREVIELSENLGRASLDWAEELRAKERIHELRVAQNPAHTMTETAEFLGEHKGNLSRDLKLAKQLREKPELAKSKSKKSAIRKVQLEEHINKRISAIKRTDVTQLRQKLYHGDARDYVRRLADQSVDLHFTDFPFGIDYFDGRIGAENVQGSYDDDPQKVRDLILDVVPHMVRTLKPDGWLACMMGWTNYRFLERCVIGACGTHAGYADTEWDDEIQSWKRSKDRCKPESRSTGTSADACRFITPEQLPWFWFRPNSRQPSKWPERHANNTIELILVANGGSARLAKPNVPNVIAADADYTERLHEMQRPHSLCLEVITRLTITGELVVDLCFGSASALAAAADCGRDFGGSELNDSSYNAGVAHVAKHWTPPATAWEAAKRTLEKSDRELLEAALAEEEAANATD